MATLAFAVAGSALGASAAGAAIGLTASSGWIIGSILGNVLFPPSGPSTVSEGPRLGDLTVSSSAYGAAVPRLFGTQRTAGNIIWSSGIEEVINTETQDVGGKGGGGGTHTQTSYEYYASFAMGLVEGEINNMLRMWADGKLIYDISGQTVDTVIAGLQFRFYRGTETQLPDALIEADKGVGKVPAHRGLCYIVFERLPLVNFGNRIPNITIELSRIDDPTLPIIEGVTFPDFDAANVFLDLNKGIVYNTNNTDFSVMTMTTMDEVSRTPIEDVAPDNSLDSDIHVLPNGDLLTGHFITGNHWAIDIINGDSLRQVQSLPTGSNNLDYITSASNSLRVSHATYTSEGTHQFIFIRSSPWGSYGIAESDPTKPTGSQWQLAYNQHTTGADLFGAGRTIVQGCRGPQNGNVCEIWLFIGKWSGFGSDPEEYAPSDIISFVRVQITTVVSAGLFGPGITNEFNYIVEAEWRADEFHQADIGASRIYGNTDMMAYSPTDGSLIVGYQVHDQTDETDNSQRHMAKYIPGSNGAFDYQVDLVDDIALVESTLQSNYIGTLANNQTYFYDLGDGSLIRQDAIEMTLAENGPVLFEGFGNSIIYQDDDLASQEAVRRILLGRSSGLGEGLDVIVEDICTSVGLTSSDIDVTSLASINVPGYTLSRTTRARDAIQPLAQFYLFDAVESDNQLVFSTRGASAVRTLTEDDLVPRNEVGDVLEEVVTQEPEMPAVLRVTYIDRADDYQQNTQQAKRISGTMNSFEIIDITPAIVSTATEARESADRLLHTAWNERSSYSFTTTWEHVDLDPADVIDVQLNNATYTMRLLSVTLGDNFEIRMSAVGENAAAYTPVLPGAPGLGVPVQVIGGIANSNLYVLNTPLLRDTDSPGSQSSVVYATAGPFTEGYNGSTIYKSADSLTYSKDLVLTSGSSWGAALTALPDTDSPFQTDEVNTLQVRMTFGGDNLASVTQLQMLNGSNPAALVKANGEVEIIQFRDVVPEGNDIYTLSGLLRGRRGTEVFTGGHAIADTFILLSNASVGPIVQALDSVNSNRFFKNIAPGQLFEDVLPVQNTNPGNDLKPYAVVNHSAVLDVSDNIDVTWVRRARIGGALQDFTDTIALYEDSEAYELEVLDGPGGSVIRTVTGLTSPAYEYPNASIIADFGSVPSQLTLNVYQLSAQVGRGFVKETTVEVE